MSNHYNQYLDEINQSVAKTKQKIINELGARKYLKYSDYLLPKIKNELAEIIKPIFPEDENIAKLIDLIEPPAHIKADFSLPIFELAKKANQNPAELSQKLADLINKPSSNYFESAEPLGPYLNIIAKKDAVFAQSLQDIIDKADQYGATDVNAKKIMIIDYSHPNIAKPIGVGHLRSTIIGQALVNLYTTTGYSVVKDNHLGDWGTQFGALIYAYQTWGDEAKVNQDPINELKNLYVKFHAETEKDPSLMDKAREIFNRLEQKDDELVALWQRFRDLSLNDFQKIYQILNISFDTYIGESYFADKTDDLVGQTIEKGLAKEENKAVVVTLPALPTFLLKKEDGSTLYMTRDLSTIEFRIQSFKPNDIIYVVGQEQELYFRQLFALSQALKLIPSATSLKHVGFGLVLTDGKKMSTRKGSVIELNELINQSVEKSKAIIKEKNPTLSDEEMNRIAQIIGIGAIIYNDLSQSRIKNITFNWDKMLDFEGGSAAYLQYTCVRINSILQKADNLSNPEKLVFETETEFNLANKLLYFPSIIVQAQTADAPNLICNYLEELAQLFNNFYNEIPILKTEDATLRQSRLTLIKSVAQIIKNGLNLLNIQVPDKM